MTVGGMGFIPERLLMMMMIEWMNEGIHLDLDTWIVPGQIRKAITVLCRGFIIVIVSS